MEQTLLLNATYEPLKVVNWQKAITLLCQGKVEVIAGINLPMLIKLASVRASEALPEAVAQAQEAGRKYINIASQLLADEGR